MGSKEFEESKNGFSRVGKKLARRQGLCTNILKKYAKKFSETWDTSACYQFDASLC